MKRFINTQHIINAPLESVWNKIAQGDGCEDWLTIITASRLEKGNKRICTMHDGSNLHETILASENNKTFMYRIDKQEAFPASDIVGFIQLDKLSESKTKLNWNVEMKVESDENFVQIKEMTEQIYKDSVLKLEGIV